MADRYFKSSWSRYHSPASMPRTHLQFSIPKLNRWGRSGEILVKLANWSTSKHRCDCICSNGPTVFPDSWDGWRSLFPPEHSAHAKYESLGSLATSEQIKGQIIDNRSILVCDYVDWEFDLSLSVGRWRPARCPNAGELSAIEV